MIFEDLKFHGDMFGMYRAKLEFPNKYGISVITGPGTYSDNNTFEVGILYDGKLCYDTNLTNDVLGYQTPEDIDNIIKKLEALPPKN
jgi:hypothetical protein